MANYSLGRRPIPDVDNGHKFVGDNFTQLFPHTAILTGKTGIQFENCNLCNCDIPADSTRKHSPNVQLSFCSNLHPEWVALGLSVCAENCEHVIDTDSVTIDGQALGTIYHYQDKIVS